MARDVLEIAYGAGHIAHAGEGAGVIVDDLQELLYLVRVDHADHHGLLRA